MSIPVISFFNNKGGVGKTSLVYHLSWMFSDLGMKVLAADLDPQSNCCYSSGSGFVFPARTRKPRPDIAHLAAGMAAAPW